jgi:SAM-dependent methyltransferase
MPRADRPASSTPWYVEAFRSEYAQVYAHRDIESARREVAYLVANGVGGRVVDLCCGFGRHTLALRERGVDAVGIDLSHELLAQARALPGGERLDGRLVRGDAQRIPMVAGAASAVIVMFSSFGYFGEEGDRDVLREIARTLRPRGRVVLDLMNPARVRAELVPHSRSEARGALIEERRALADGGQRVIKDVRVRLADGHERTWREDVRMYEPAEIAVLLRASGFELAIVHGDFDGAPFDVRSPRQIVHAVRTAA